jgi:hypothetical protein
MILDVIRLHNFCKPVKTYAILLRPGTPQEAEELEVVMFTKPVVGTQPCTTRTILAATTRLLPISLCSDIGVAIIVASEERVF